MILAEEIDFSHQKAYQGGTFYLQNQAKVIMKSILIHEGEVYDS